MMKNNNALFRKQIELLALAKSILRTADLDSYQKYQVKVRDAILDLFYESSSNLKREFIALLPVDKISSYRSLLEFLRGINGTANGTIYLSLFGSMQQTTNSLVDLISELENTIKEQLNLRSQFTVFYSWQCDSVSSLNRNFIEDALKQAIKNVNKDSDLKLNIDKDTRGETGSPDIFPAIIRKIDDALIFVADITPVITLGDKEIPNPNVMCELGYALSSLSDERIIIICNSSKCDIKQLPFDLGLKRAVLYSLSDESTPEERKKAKEKLVETLTIAIRQIRDM